MTGKDAPPEVKIRSYRDSPICDVVAGRRAGSSTVSGSCAMLRPLVGSAGRCPDSHSLRVVAGVAGNLDGSMDTGRL